MPELPQFAAFDVTAKLQQDLEFSLTAGTEDPLAGTGATVPVSISTQEVTQNADGSWNEVVYDKESPVKDQGQIISEFKEKRLSTIQSYEDMGAVYDIDILNFNNQINTKKTLIASLVTTAIGAGCSNISSDAANINGVACGIGSTIKSDQATLNIYENMSNYSANSPFDPITSEDLSNSNLGKGFENVTSNNTGSIITTTYRYIPTDPAAHTGTIFLPLTPAEQAICAGYGSSILTIASEIETLRGQRDQYLGEVNNIKSLKKGEELALWGDKQTEIGLDAYQSALQSAISSLTQFTDDIVTEGLIVHFDAALDSGITAQISNEPAFLGINSITSWYNLGGDGLYANARTSLYPINLDTADGPSAELNNYPSVTNQYFDVASSYIGSGKIGTGSTSYSVEVWTKVTSDTNLGISSTTNGACIVGINSIHGYGMQVYKPSGIRVSFGERGNGSLVNSTNLSTNTWYHIVGTNEAGVGSKIYVNGVLDGSGSQINVTSSTSNLQFAYAPGKISQYFAGKLSVIRVYKKTLTQDEITKNFNAHKARYGY